VTPIKKPTIISLIVGDRFVYEGALFSDRAMKLNQQDIHFSLA
jgi:hypothetical protein